MTEENPTCACGSPAVHECHCGQDVCQECIDDPSSPAAHNWHDTGWTVCSYKCEERAIDALQAECAGHARALKQWTKDIKDIIVYAKSASGCIQKQQYTEASLNVGRILSYEYLVA